MKMVLIGKDLERYRIIEQIGEGGIATVFKAYDPILEREIALKVTRRDVSTTNDADTVFRHFEREAIPMARLSHQNIVKVYDSGSHEGAPFLVMELISGGSLKKQMEKAKPYPEAARLLAPTARALSLP